MRLIIKSIYVDDCIIELHFTKGTMLKTLRTHDCSNDAVNELDNKGSL